MGGEGTRGDFVTVATLLDGVEFAVDASDRVRGLAKRERQRLQVICRVTSERKERWGKRIPTSNET